MFHVERRAWLVAALCSVCTPGRGQGRATRTALVVGLITPRSAEQTRKNWSPFVERMGEALQQPVDLRLFADQRELLTQLAQGGVDVAWMGNAAALDAVLAGSGSVFAQMITKTGSAGYHSILVVPEKAPLKTLADVIKAGPALRFGDGDLKSTSGHSVPAYFAFQKNGVNDVKKLFRSVTHHNHQNNLTLTANGELDVATANSEELAFFARDFPALARNLRVVWESPLIPQSPLVWRNNLTPEMRRRILQFTITFGKTDEEKQILDELNSLSGFRQSSNRQLVVVADLEMFKARQAINDDKTLTPEERTRRIDEVIRRGSKLELMLKLSAVPVK
jgi:phosphonate transport system substrate-binding protein